jgi:hypothetical protein
MKRMIQSFLASILLLFPPYALSMAVTAESLEEKFKKAFDKKVATIKQERAEHYFRATGTRDSDTQTQKRISSYTPSTDQEWEIVVVD